MDRAALRLPLPLVVVVVLVCRLAHATTMACPPGGVPYPSSASSTSSAGGSTAAGSCSALQSGSPWPVAEGRSLQRAYTVPFSVGGEDADGSVVTLARETVDCALLVATLTATDQVISVCADQTNVVSLTGADAFCGALQTFDLENFFLQRIRSTVLVDVYNATGAVSTPAMVVPIHRTLSGSFEDGVVALTLDRTEVLWAEYLVEQEYIDCVSAVGGSTDYVLAAGFGLAATASSSLQGNSSMRNVTLVALQASNGSEAWRAVTQVNEDDAAAEGGSSVVCPAVGWGNGTKASGDDELRIYTPVGRALFAHDGYSGELLWNRTLSNSTTAIGDFTVVVDNDDDGDEAIVCSTNDTVFRIAGSTGEVRLSYTLDMPSIVNIESFVVNASAGSSPVAFLLLTVQEDGTMDSQSLNLTAVDLSVGGATRLWSTRLPARANNSFASGTVSAYTHPVLTPDGVLVCVHDGCTLVNDEDGTALWSAWTPAVDDKITSGPIIGPAGQVIVGMQGAVNHTLWAFVLNGTVAGGDRGLCNAGNSLALAQTESPAQSCVVCAAGSYIVDGFCVPCPPGYYSAFAGAPTCMSCPKRTASNVCGANSSDTCETCPAGYVSDAAGTATCTACDAGTYAAANETLCSLCPTDTYSNVTAATSNQTCRDCPASQTADPGSSECTSLAVDDDGVDDDGDDNGGGGGPSQVDTAAEIVVVVFVVIGAVGCIVGGGFLVRHFQALDKTERETMRLSGLWDAELAKFGVDDEPSPSFSAHRLSEPTISNSAAVAAGAGSGSGMRRGSGRSHAQKDHRSRSVSSAKSSTTPAAAAGAVASESVTNPLMKR